MLKTALPILSSVPDCVLKYAVIPAPADILPAVAVPNPLVTSAEVVPAPVFGKSIVLLPSPLTVPNLYVLLKSLAVSTPAAVT